jgi:hypothetical protein
MILEIFISFLIVIVILAIIIGIVLLFVYLKEQELLGIAFVFLLLIVIIAFGTYEVYSKIQEHKVIVLYETEIKPRLNPSLHDK